MKYTVTEKVLSKGTKGLLIDVPGTEVVQVKIFFRGGFQFGDFTKFELPHVLEHLILSSSKGYPGNNQLRSEFTKNGTQYNAHTNKNNLIYWIQSPDVDFERSYKLFMEGIKEPVLHESSLEAEIGNVSNELTSKLSQGSSIPSLLSLPANFPQHFIPMQQRIDQLPTIALSDIERFFKETHTVANSSFIVAGAVNRFLPLIIDELEALYEHLPVGHKNTFNQSPGRGQKDPLIHFDSQGSEYFQIDWFEEGGDLAEAAAYNIASSVLSSGWDSRIFGRLRNLGASYGTYTDYSHSQDSLHFSVYGRANSDKMVEVVEVVAEEVQRIVSEPLKRSEIEQAVLRIEGGLKVGIQTPVSLSSAFQDEFVVNERIITQEDYLELLKKVTPEDVQRAASKAFLSKRHSSAYSGPVSLDQIVEIEKPLAPVWR